MKRNISLYLQDIWDSIQAIEQYVQGTSEEAFGENQQLQDAVIRRLEIIGEAVKNVPENFRAKHPTLPWKEMAGMRDVLIHEYFGVNVERVWEVIRKDFPLLKQKLNAIIKQGK